MDFVIRRCDIGTAVSVSRAIPELENPYDTAEYQRRFEDTPNLLLAAYHDEKAVGFKAGYQRSGYFYSWMGGVLPAYRRLGAAKALARAQERWAKQQGYDSITFKTLNAHKAMLLFALKNGFDIIGLEEKPDVGTNRIWLKKLLV